MTSTKPQSQSATGKNKLWGSGGLGKSSKKGTQTWKELLSQVNDSTETVITGKTRGTENRKELPKGSTDNLAPVPAPVPAHNSESEWPQNAVIAQINVGCPVSSLLLLDGGRRMAIICELEKKNRLQFWSADKGQFIEIEPPLEEGSMVNAIAASKDGKWIVSGYLDGRVVIWDAAPDPIERVREFVAAKGAGCKITALDISPDSSYVAIGSGDGKLVVWSIESRRCTLGPLHHQNSSPISSIKFSPSGGRIASGYFMPVGEGDTSIHLWHSCTGVRVGSVRNQHPTHSLAWSIDGHHLFAGGSGGSFKCFDLLTRACLVEPVPPSTRARDRVTSICVSNSGQFLASVSSGRDHAIDIWDISHIPFCKHLRSRNEVAVASISHDNSRLISVGKDNHITSWSLSTLLDGAYLFHFTYVSHAVLEAWKKGNFEEAEEKLGKQIGVNDDTSNFPGGLYALVNRALVRVRRKDWAAALNDVAAVREQPNNGRAGLIACIAEAIAFHGQGKCKEALESFKSVLRGCDSDLFKCIKVWTVHECTDVDDHMPSGNLSRLVEVSTSLRDSWKSPGLTRNVKARKILLRARRECQMDEKGYEEALKQLETVPDLCPLLQLQDVKTTLLLFDWDIGCLISDIHDLRCRALIKFGQASPQPLKMNYFSVEQTDLTEDREVIQAKLSCLSERFGGEAVRRRKYNEAIALYSEALILAGYPLFTVGEDRMPSGLGSGANTTSRSRSISGLLAKRSKGKAHMGLWQDALIDATRVIESDPSYPSGYERKFVALHAMRRFKEAVSTLKEMSSRFIDPYGPEVFYLPNYTKAIGKIDELIKTIFDNSPFVVIDVETGYLCDQEKRRNIFEDDPRYYKLVSSMSVVLNTEHIKKLSKTTSATSCSLTLYDLVLSPQNKKLRRFCETVREEYKDHDYRWSWSDTCCIDKKNPDIHEKSIRFMYKWYHNSALTLVRLADPSKSTPYDSPSLEHNRWMFRAWTLQELLASQVIRFYRHDWELYVDGNEFNHKKLSRIKQELQNTMTNVKNVLQDDFSPDSLTVRQRLQLASTREATKKVDMAYALIGIFSSDINVDSHREGDIALGLLLQEIVNRQGDVSVIDWIGQSSKFNSSIPAVISVYKPTPYEPYNLPRITGDMISRRVGEMDDTSLKEEVSGLLDFLFTLGLPRFADRRLSLPCVTFSVSKISHDTSRTPGQGTTAYIVSTAALGEVQLETRDKYLSRLLGESADAEPNERVVLVYPWIRDLLAQIRRRGRNKHDRAASLIVYLEQGFRALLFAEQSDQQYRRVATDMKITVSARRLTSLEDVSAEMLEVWEKS
ncbi:hypothetical protein JVU11DRAFT_3593 [Chiua virens]|nr:hypothetical protein JVU11DRAFT_3593 [Chiua virens]